MAPTDDAPESLAIPFPVKSALAFLWPFLKGALTTWGTSALADLLVRNASEHLSRNERDRLREVLAEVAQGL